MTQIIQCVPNFSEGRRTSVMEAIVASVRETPGVRLADWSADSDHNRMVVTFVGPPEPVHQAALAACRVTVRHIDISEHKGIHPRLGALDVLPFVPIIGVSLEDCVKLARQVGKEIADEHGLPVFLYEAAADNRSLPFVRREAFQTVLPDFGPLQPHPTAGAVVVGARNPLIAYNVNLATPTPTVARTIARELREGGGAGFVGIRALGLVLESRGLSQVSLNITRPADTPLLSVFNYIAQRARELGTLVIESEVIGALPGLTALGVIADALQAELKPGQILWESIP